MRDCGTYKPKFQPWNEETFRSDIDVQAMSPPQRSLYRCLLHQSFFCSTRPNLPVDDEKLWKLADALSLSHWQRSKGPVLKMFTEIVVNGERVLSNKRVLDDWNKMTASREAKAEGGRKGQATQRQQEGGDMRAVKQIPILSLSILGVKSERADSNCWREVRQLAAAFGEHSVIEAFESWATAHRGETLNGYPVSAFLKIATGMLNGSVVVGSNPALDSLLTKLSNISGLDVTFNTEQQSALAVWLKDTPEADIVAAFAEFYSRVDDYSRKFAAKDFIAKGSQFIRVVRQERDRRAEHDRLQEELANGAQAAVQSELAAIEARRLAEQEQVEDEL